MSQSLSQIYLHVDLKEYIRNPPLRQPHILLFRQIVRIPIVGGPVRRTYQVPGGG
jgi:hypothetical protein